MSVVNEEKQRSERSQIFHFNSGESKTAWWSAVSQEKQRIASVVRNFILIVVKVQKHSQRFPFNISEEKQRSECSQ